jgi:predicted GIY-YIG superfamily endonuclease
MFIVYLFKEKKTETVIYVGSSARPAERMKEHIASIKGNKPRNKIQRYMHSNGLELFKDVEVIWIDCAESRDEMISKEQEYYYKHVNTIMNERPGDNKSGWYNPRRRVIRCVNNGVEYRTVTECAELLNVGRTTLSDVLNNRKPHLNVNGEKLLFEYVNKTCND